MTTKYFYILLYPEVVLKLFFSMQLVATAIFLNEEQARIQEMFSEWVFVSSNFLNNPPIIIVAPNY